MPSFTELFIKSKGKPVQYKGNTVISCDKFPVEDGDILVANIESTKSKYRQGLSIDITGHCEFDGKVYKQGKGVNMLFWEDTSPGGIRLAVFTKKDFVWIENIWERISHFLVSDEQGNPIEKTSTSVESRYNGAAMIVEEIENGRRYRCNDGKPVMTSTTSFSLLKK